MDAPNNTCCEHHQPLFERLREENEAYQKSYIRLTDKVEGLKSRIAELEAQRDEWKAAATVINTEYNLKANASAERIAELEAALRKVDAAIDKWASEWDNTWQGGEVSEIVEAALSGREGKR